MNKIEFVNLYRQYESIKEEIDCAIKNTIQKSEYIRGASVDLFEENFSNLIGAKYCVSCANGTDALYIALKSLKLQSEQEVIVPAMTWISTSETVTQAGGKVIFCDIDPRSNNMSTLDLQKRINKNTVGIIPVHLYGNPADLPDISNIAVKHNLWIIEDCAQAHLAQINDKNVGTYGDISTFSFYPGKNLGAMGDAGAILTNSEKLYDFMAMYSRHGGKNKGEHNIEGINSRMDGLQAAILNVKMKYIKDWTIKRQQIAEVYNEQLLGIEELILPEIRSDGVNQVWHLYVIKYKKRNELISYLLNKGISTSINYKTALPFLPCYSKYDHKIEDFPNAFELQNNGLSLPIYPELNEEEIKYICNCIKEFINAEN